MYKRIWLLAGGLLLAVSTLVVGTISTDAHEHRTVGDYEWVVGFLNEPAVEDELNAISVRISSPAPPGATPAAGEEKAAATPVEGLEVSLTFEIIFGDQIRALPVETVFRDPGHYVAYVIPTEPGDYSFRITGEINGVPVEETFTAGPETFSSVAPRTDIEFPSSS